MSTKVVVLFLLVAVCAIGLAPNAGAVAADVPCGTRCEAPPDCPPECCCCPCPICGGDDCIVCSALQCATIAWQRSRPAPPVSTLPCDGGACCEVRQ